MDAPRNGRRGECPRDRAAVVAPAARWFMGRREPAISWHANPFRHTGVMRKGNRQMSENRTPTFNRRKLIGAATGAGAITMLGSLGKSAIAAPKGVPAFIRSSNQETTTLTFWHLS